MRRGRAVQRTFLTGPNKTSTSEISEDLSASLKTSDIIEASSSVRYLHVPLYDVTQDAAC